AGARLNYTKMQNQHNASALINHRYIYQERESHVNSTAVTLHGGIVRNNLFVRMAGEGGTNISSGLFLTDQGQHVDNFTWVEHAAPHCESRQFFKGILDDFSSGAFSGRIVVKPGAQKTNAYQKNNNLLLTNDARMNTRPQLEIYADDVKCSHGATVGQLDKDAMFYLRSRGIGYEEARFLLMFAFANEVLANIPVVPLRARIADLVNKRLRRELSPCNSCPMHCC
ncbi:MAG: Fe-S cluster assembly protein SufD, partial [Bacteroidales bacterium]